MEHSVEHATNRLAQILGKQKVSTRLIDRVAYSCDASLYQLVPRVVVHASSISDIIELFAWSRREHIPLTFRAAGTSLSGQAITEHALVALGGFRELDIAPDGNWVRAGCMLRGGYVNGRLRSYHRRIGPDPASIDACTIGGIVANNASGMCCGIAQNAYHTLLSMTFVLPSGTIIDTRDLEAADQQLAEQEPTLYAGLAALRDHVRSDPALVELIGHRTRLKNTMGYSIAAFLDFDRPVDILQHLLVGSEGTLGFIASVQLATVDDPPYATTLLVGYRNVADACRAVDAFDGEGAVAVELMDDATLAAIARHSNERTLPSLPKAAALLVEFRYDDPERTAIMDRHAAEIARRTGATSVTVAADHLQRQSLWRVRKGAMPSVGAARAVGSALINEDVAFPRSQLAAAVGDLRLLLGRYGFVDAVIFGHARDGNMHFAFSLGADEPSIERYGRFMDELAELVVGKYDGSLKAEHSTGRNMAPYLEHQWGERATALMWKIKELVDPEHLLNRDVMLSRNRTIHVQNIKQLPAVHPIVDRCIECGFCEHVCPSAALTLSPRQRIIVLRQIQREESTGRNHHATELARSFRYTGDQTCAADGMCQRGCPVGINTGEFIVAYRQKQKRPLGALVAAVTARNVRRWISSLGTASTLAHRIACVVGAQPLTWVTAMLARTMRVPSWLPTIGLPYRIRPRCCEHAAMVFVPSCMACFGGRSPKDGESVTEALLQLAERAGLAIAIAKQAGSVCCGQPWHSSGREDDYRRVLTAWIEAAYQASKGGQMPVVIDSSSCALSLQTAREHIDGPTAERLARLQILGPVEAAEKICAMLPHPLRRRYRVVVHPPCSLERSNQRAQVVGLFESLGCEVTIPDSVGCCGMAGDRGLRFPELPRAALQHQREDIASIDADFYVSTNLPCQWQLAAATGKPYRSLWCVLEQISR